LEADFWDFGAVPVLFGECAGDFSGPVDFSAMGFF
jgi:hypothetical protein